VADLASVQDQPQRNGRPVALGQKLHQLELDLDRIGLLRPPEALRQAPHVRVDRDARGREGAPEDHIGRLPPGARDRDELLQRLRHRSVEGRDDAPGAFLDALRLVPAEAGRPHDRFDRVPRRRGERRRVRIAREEQRRHLIDARVGALRREHGRDVELERIAEVEGAARIRVDPPQRAHDAARALSDGCAGHGSAPPRQR